MCIWKIAQKMTIKTNLSAFFLTWQKGFQLAAMKILQSITDYLWMQMIYSICTCDFKMWPSKIWLRAFKHAEFMPLVLYSSELWCVNMECEFTECVRAITHNCHVNYSFAFAGHPKSTVCHLLWLSHYGPARKLSL